MYLGLLVWLSLLLLWTILHVTELLGGLDAWCMSKVKVCYGVHTCRYHRKPGELCGYVSRQFTLLSFLRWSSDYTHSLALGVSPIWSVSYFQGYYVGGHLQLAYHNATVCSGRILDWTCVLCEVASFPLCTWRLLSLLAYSLGLD